uniref:Uncharacterized protein n=1 Tax=Magallana gigas TaxID=29159 RepID=A0A8W8M4Z5_MAGGI
MEATQELQLEKLHSTHQRVDSKSNATPFELDTVDSLTQRSGREPASVTSQLRADQLCIWTYGREDGATQHTGASRGRDLEIQADRRRTAE